MAPRYQKGIIKGIRGIIVHATVGWLGEAFTG
jgi:hypothetical protein